MVKLRHLLVTSVCASWYLVAPTTASAQSATPATEPVKSGQEQSADQAGAGDSGADIIITARKRTESLQEVPVAVTAFGGEQLEQKGVQTLSQISRFTPGLETRSSYLSSNIVIFGIRGQVASDVNLTFDQAVGVYVDGVDYPRPYGLQAALVDIAKVEILKGPQGTLYGRNSTGGAVNLISNQPDHNATHGYLTADLTNYKGRRVTGALNLPLTDTLAVRFAAQYWDRDGYGRSRVTGQRFGGDKGISYLRAIVQFDPTDRLSLNVRADVTRIRENGALFVARNYTDNTATNQQVAIQMGLDPTLPASLATARAKLQEIATLGDDIFTSDADTNFLETLDRKSVSGTLTYALSDDVDFKLIGGYSHLLRDSRLEYDATRFKIVTTGIQSPGPFLFDRPYQTVDSTYSAEANLSGRAFDGALDWIVGVYYGYENGREIATNEIRPDQNLQIARNPYLLNLAEASRVTSENYSLYTQSDLRISDRLTLTGGVRVTHDAREVTQALRRFAPSTGLYLCTATSPQRTTTTPSDCAITRNAAVTRWSWLGSINYKISDDVFVYAKTSRSFRAGGFDLRLIAPAFAPETAQDIELGVKVSAMNGLIRANLAAYRTKYKNKQERTIVAINNTSVAVTSNAADATIKGVEGEFSVTPTSGLRFDATVGYLEGRYDSFKTALNLFNQPVDASGERFSNPRWTYSIAGQYEAELPSGSLTFQAGWSWQAAADVPLRLTDSALPPALFKELNEYDLGLLNGRVEYSNRDHDFSIGLFATNLLNKKYQDTGIPQSSSGGVQAGVTREPRIWGMRPRKGFGGGR